MDGSSTTTIGGSHIGMWKLTKVISLPVMREVTATLCLWTKGCSRAVTITPTDSPVEDAEMDAGDVPPDQAEQEISRLVRGGLTKLRAATLLTSRSMGVNFQQFCDRLCRGLPGDSTKRECFDTRTRFVVGDPGARFNDLAPLEYEVTGETGRPHWDLIFEHILRQCGYLVEFQTVYVMVDNRDLANHQRRDSSLPH